MRRSRLVWVVRLRLVRVVDRCRWPSIHAAALGSGDPVLLLLVYAYVLLEVALVLDVR